MPRPHPSGRGFRGTGAESERLQEGPKPTSAEIRFTRVERIGNLVLDVGTFSITLPDAQRSMEGEYLVLAEDIDDGIRIRRLIGFPPRRAPNSSNDGAD